jgi:hypothetical protein
VPDHAERQTARHDDLSLRGEIGDEPKFDVVDQSDPETVTATLRAAGFVDIALEATDETGGRLGGGIWLITATRPPR